ncbi:MAG: universal stress protein UspA [Peptococcaceae bacterium BICA1-7]|nr:MAG: universal stress protein UspA [Peptococcaceae bacterium BICA1-7]HBV96777.1 universal stress protein [Desulfotomaculum sp.]
MYKKVLVPLDGSIRANLAAEHAMDLAKTMKAEVMFLHVIPALPPYVNSYSDRLGGAYQQIHDELEATGREIMEKAKKDFENSGVSLEVKVLWGNPAMEICREAKEGRFDLVIMGSRGLGEIKGYLMGSISNRVVRHASCPVLVVR